MPYRAPEGVPQSGGLPKTEQYYDRTTPSLNIFATPLSFPIDDSALMTINFNTKNRLQNWQNFVSSLGTFKTLTDRIRAENERKRYTEGMLASAQGLNLPEHAAKAYTEGYYNYQANLDFQTYSTSLQLFAAENIGTWETQEEVEQALDQFTNQFLEARPINDTYLNALLPSILEQNSAVINAWTQQKVAQVQEDIINTTIAGIQKTADDVLETGLQEFLGVSSLEVLANDPKFLETGITNPDIHGLLRDGLTRAQQDAETMGFSKVDASEIYVHRVGTLAVKYGMPELLDFTSIPDKNGIALDQTVLSEAIDTYRIQASQVKQQKLAAIAELQETQYQEYLDGFYKSTFSQISSLMYLSETDPVLAKEEALRIQQKLFDEESPLWDLSQTNFREITDTLHKLVFNPKDFPSVSDDETFIDFQKQAWKNELSEEELNIALRDGKLSKEDYLKLLDIVYEAKAEEEQRRREYFEGLLVSKAKLTEITPEELDSILYDQNISQSTKDAIRDEYIKQQETRVRTEEELAKAQEEAAEAQKAQNQAMLYMDYLTKLSTGDLLPSEALIYEIRDQVAKENLSPSKGEALVNRINDLLEEADKAKINSVYGPYKNPALDDLVDSTIEFWSADPSLMDVINPGLKADLEIYALYLDQSFREQYGTNPEKALELYEANVIAPLEEYARKKYMAVYGFIPEHKQQTRPEVSTNNTTQNTQVPSSSLNRATQSVQSTLEASPLTTTVATPQQMITNTITKGLITNETQVSIGNLQEQLVLEGYTPEAARSAIMGSVIEQAKQFVIDNGSSIETQIQLQMRLMDMGFSYDETNYILGQLGVTGW